MRSRMEALGRRNTALDVLRAIAVLLVLGRHAEYRPRDFPGVLAKGYGVWLRAGWSGVDLFFVLSGFLVAGLILREHRRHGRVAPLRFYVRRGFKIYPAFYVFLAFTVAFHALTGARADWGRAALFEAVFLQNYGQTLWPHTWSLAVEEHFYLALPPVLMLALRGDPRRALRVVAAVSVTLLVACLVLRAWTLQRVGFSHQALVFPTHLRVDALFFGVLLAVLYHHHGEALARFVRRASLPLLVVGLALVVPNALLPLERSAYVPTLGYTANTLGFGMLLLWAVHRDPVRRIPGVHAVGAGLARLGFYSYSVYLWHVPARFLVGALERRVLGAPLEPLVGFALYVVGAIALGIGMAKAIEVPLLRVRDRLFPSRSDRPVVTDRA